MLNFLQHTTQDTKLSAQDTNLLQHTTQDTNPSAANSTKKLTLLQQTAQRY
jgi:hypothetical protein